MPSFCYTCRKNHDLKAATKAHPISPAGDPFVALLKVAFEKAREADQAKRLEERGTLDKETMYLSDGVECLRQIVWARQNREVTNPPDIYSLMNFQVGHAVQEAVARVLTHLGGELIEEHHIDVEVDGSHVTGRSDFLLDIPRSVLESLNLGGAELPEHNLIEIKATGEAAMVAMLGRGEEGKDGHRRQLNRYTHASRLGLMGDRKYEGGWLTYFVPLLPKGQPNFFPFWVPYNPALATGDLDYLAHADRMATAGEDPGIPPEFLQAYENSKKSPKMPPVWPCQYCPFLETCWEEVFLGRTSTKQEQPQLTVIEGGK